jgi:hypothetical protein
MSMQIRHRRKQEANTSKIIAGLPISARKERRSINLQQINRIYDANHDKDVNESKFNVLPGVAHFT